MARWQKGTGAGVSCASANTLWDPPPAPICNCSRCCPSHKPLALLRSFLPRSALAISAMATSFFASALAMARMARCTEERGIPVPAAMGAFDYPAMGEHRTARDFFSDDDKAHTGWDARPTEQLRPAAAQSQGGIATLGGYRANAAPSQWRVRQRTVRAHHC